MEFDRPLTLLIVGIYFATLLGVGFHASRKIKKASDYIVAGRNLGFWVFILLVTGSAASGMTILGISGLGFAAGWPSFWEQICVPLGCSLCLILFGVKLSRLADIRGYMTIEDYLCERYYSDRFMRMASSISVSFVSLVYLVGQFVAVSFIIGWMLDISHTFALLVGAGITMTYVLLGGLHAIARIAFFQVLIMIFGVLVLAPMIISQAPDFNEHLASINVNMVRAFYPQEHPPEPAYAFFTPLFTFSFVLFLPFGLASAPHIVNNMLAVSNKKYFKWAPLIVFLIYFVVVALIKVSGFSARAMAEKGIIDVTRPDRCFIQAVEYVLKNLKFLSVLAGTAILAAVMTTTDRLMLTIGNCVSWDIYKNYIHKTADDKTVNFMNRMTIFVTTIIAVVAALNPPKLLAFLIWAAVGVMFSTFTVPLLGGLYWKRATRQAGIIAMILGFVTSIVFAFVHKFYMPLPAHFSLFSFVISVGSFVVVSMMTTKPPQEVIENTQTGFYIKPKL